MNRRLIVMRHAKSSWEGDTTDHERPLNDRGRDEAPRVARRLDELGWRPEFVLSSDAARTRETLACLNAAWEDEVPSELLSSLYLAGYDQLRADVGIVSDDVNTLLVLGHNPGWEGIVYALSGQHVTLKTATAALLELETGKVAPTWSEVIRNMKQWRLIDVIRGKTA